MNDYILGSSDNTLLVVTVIVFTLLFVMILKSLKQASIFGKITTVVVSLCASLLCIIGLSQTFVPTEKASDVSGNSSNPTPELDLILLLYAALAVTLLLFPFLLFIAKIFHGYKYRKKSKRLNRWSEKYDHFSDIYQPRLKRDEDRFTK